MIIRPQKTKTYSKRAFDFNRQSVDLYGNGCRMIPCEEDVTIEAKSETFVIKYEDIADFHIDINGMEFSMKNGKKIKIYF